MGSIHEKNRGKKSRATVFSVYLPDLKDKIDYMQGFNHKGLIGNNVINMNSPPFKY